MKRFLLTACVLISLSSPLMAQYEEQDYRIHPMIGLWFGPITPIPGTELAGTLNTSLGFGGYFRINIPSDTFQMETGAYYSQLTSFLTNRLIMVPVYGALVFKLPIQFALSFYFKGGAGSGYFENKPEVHGGWLPIFYAGFETTFPAGRWANVGARLDYYFIYESWMKVPSGYPSGYKLINGHMIALSIVANFNTNP